MAQHWHNTGKCPDGCSEIDRPDRPSGRAPRSRRSRTGRRHALGGDRVATADPSHVERRLRPSRTGRERLVPRTHSQAGPRRRRAVGVVLRRDERHGVRLPDLQLQEPGHRPRPACQQRLQLPGHPVEVHRRRLPGLHPVDPVLHHRRLGLPREQPQADPDLGPHGSRRLRLLPRRAYPQRRAADADARGRRDRALLDGHCTGRGRLRPRLERQRHRRSHQQPDRAADADVPVPQPQLHESAQLLAHRRDRRLRLHRQPPALPRGGRVVLGELHQP